MQVLKEGHNKLYLAMCSMPFAMGIGNGAVRDTLDFRIIHWTIGKADNMIVLSEGAESKVGAGVERPCSRTPNTTNIHVLCLASGGIGACS
uniref:Uncharacterized protein n=1 Tax=Oryza sativa subsp. japonica TaxID=39947 RepID=Q6YY71_ORYSJ|nr:hypothetical protein [Oryza sativa Japonica Group]